MLDAIDSLQLPARDYSKPLLMPICDVIKSQSQGQVSACGKLENGAIRTGLRVRDFLCRYLLIDKQIYGLMWKSSSAPFKHDYFLFFLVFRCLQLKASITFFLSLIIEC